MNIHDYRSYSLRQSVFVLPFCRWSLGKNRRYDLPSSEAGLSLCNFASFSMWPWPQKIRLVTKGADEARFKRRKTKLEGCTELHVWRPQLHLGWPHITRRFSSQPTNTSWYINPYMSSTRIHGQSWHSLNPIFHAKQLLKFTLFSFSDKPLKKEKSCQFDNLKQWVLTGFCSYQLWYVMITYRNIHTRFQFTVPYLHSGACGMALLLGRFWWLGHFRPMGGIVQMVDACWY